MATSPELHSGTPPVIFKRGFCLIRWNKRGEGNMGKINRRISLFALSALLLSAAWAWTYDWPQWRGLNRDGHSRETGLLKEWPKEGPKLLWQINDLGSGYAAPSVTGGRIYLMSNKGLEDEFVDALDVKDGKKLWSARVGKVGNPDQKPSFPAARSTPTVDGTMIYALGSDGDLVCLESKTGKSRWQKSLRKDFGGVSGMWAYSESPLIDGNVLACTPGGKDATMVALDKRTGEVIWKSAFPGSDMAGYASLVVANTGGIKQYVAYTASGLVGVDAKTGKFLWRYEKNKGAVGMSIQTPVVRDDFVYAGANRVGGGAVLLKALQGSIAAEEAYFDPKLPTAIGGTVMVGNYIYGSGQTALMCVEYKTGQIKWSERSIAPASLCYAEELLYMHGEEGDVALVEASPESYREHGRFAPPNQPKHGNAMEKAWAYPVIADARLYIRDLNALWCYDIKASK
jgi:outer membrane protein assembly factor BamB